MKGKLSAKISPEGAVLLLLALLCALAVSTIHRNDETAGTPADSDTYILLEPVPAETEHAGARAVYTFILPDYPEGEGKHLRLTGLLKHAYVRLSADGMGMLFETREGSRGQIGKTPGKYWMEVPVPPGASGKTFRMEVASVFPGAAGEVGSLALASADTVLAHELPKDGLMIFLGLLAVMTGILVTVLPWFMRDYVMARKAVRYLGAVTACAGLWKLSGLPAVLLILRPLDASREIWYSGSFLYLIMPVLFLRAMILIGKREKNRADRICFLACAAGAALLVILQLLGAAELYTFAVPYGTGIALVHLFRTLKAGNWKKERMWILPFFLSMGIDILELALTGNMRYSPCLLLWMALNLYVRAFGQISRSIRQAQILQQQERELSNLRIKTMMKEIRPHFIYNTLSSVYVLCREDPEKAARVVNDFTGYLQANFNLLAADGLIPFQEEFRHTQAYLAVESALYEEALKVEYDAEFTAFRLPPLTLQPLVENAVKHGVGEGFSPGEIRIRTRRLGEAAEITVEDNGPGIDPAAGSAYGGMENVRDRLRLMCGGELAIRPREAGGTAATVSIPLENG